MIKEIKFPKDPRFKDLTGKRFGRLKVLSYAGYDKASHLSLWLCQCDCGTRKIFRIKGGIKSCDCRRREATIKRNTTHGMRFSKEYSIWRSMIDRCKSPKVKSYKYYGARGITVCERWKNSFEAFLEDMGRCPKNKHSIDRKNTNGNYEPGNCRWATWIEQQRNRRNNHFIKFRGETHCISEWGEITGISQYAICKRLKLGWSVEKTLTTPVRKKVENRSTRTCTVTGRDSLTWYVRSKEDQKRLF